MRYIRWPDNLPFWVETEVYVYLATLTPNVGFAGKDIEFKDFDDYLGFKDRFAKWFTAYPVPDPVAMPKD